MSAATPVAAAPVLATASPVRPSAAATEALAEPSGLSGSPGLPEPLESSELPESDPPEPFESSEPPELPEF